MSYRIAGIDVHKKMLAVVVSDVEMKANTNLSDGCLAATLKQLRSLAAWSSSKRPKNSHGVDGAFGTRVGNTGKVLEAALREAGRSRRRSGTLHLAQALSNRGDGTQEGFRRRRTLGEAAGGRELTLSFVPMPSNAYGER